LFLEAVVLHLWIGLLLKIIPFKRIQMVFANPQFEAPTQKGAQTRHIVSGRKSEVIDFIRIAILRSGRVSPWKNRCLVSSLAGRCMLRRRKITSQLSLGVAKSAEGKTIAHAWLRAGNVEIVSAHDGFQEMFHF